MTTGHENLGNPPAGFGPEVDGEQLGRVASVGRNGIWIATDSGRVLTGVDPELCVGDWVIVDPAEAIVRQRGKRTTELTRTSADGLSVQVLAVNVDVVAVVLAADQHSSGSKIDRFLAIAWSSGARPLIVLTKADLHPDPAGWLADVSGETVGVDVMTASCTDETAAQLPIAAPGETVVFIGESGAGKTSLINALADVDQQLATTEVRADSKGRHTTTSRELISLRCGAVAIDTPGVRSIGLVDSDGVDSVFEDVAEWALHCRFRDCTHRSEPGCAVLEHVPADRLARYHKLMRAASWTENRDNPLYHRRQLGALKASNRSLRRAPEHYRHH